MLIFAPGQNGFVVGVKRVSMIKFILLVVKLDGLLRDNIISNLQKLLQSFLSYETQ